MFTQSHYRGFRNQLTKRSRRLMNTVRSYWRSRVLGTLPGKPTGSFGESPQLRAPHALNTNSLRPLFWQDWQEKVIVTGSRIATVDNCSAVGPVNVILAEEMLVSGKATWAICSKSLPAVTVLLDGTKIDDDSVGLQTINLRGLGDDRVLALLSGLRVSPVGSRIDNLVDLSICRALAAMPIKSVISPGSQIQT